MCMNIECLKALETEAIMPLILADSNTRYRGLISIEHSTFELKLSGLGTHHIWSIYIFSTLPRIPNLTFLYSPVNPKFR